MTASRQPAHSSFADFIRNAKAREKRRVYTTALAEAARSQNELLGVAAAQQQRTASPA